MQISIIMGSASDAEIAEGAREILRKFGIEPDVKVLSAHRNPEKLRTYIREAEEDGVKVFIAFAGKAAHLAGTIAAHTIKPVIGVPVKSSTLGGLEALLSTVEMPGGVPVACVAINGAKNAGLLAVQILATADAELSSKIKAYKESL